MNKDVELFTKWENEIRQRCNEQRIDVSDCYLLISDGRTTYFAGEPVSGWNESEDERWICIPIYDDEASNVSGKYEYSPHCFEVKMKLQTYLSNGSMLVLSDIWCLRK